MSFREQYKGKNKPVTHFGGLKLPLFSPQFKTAVESGEMT